MKGIIDAYMAPLEKIKAGKRFSDWRINRRLARWSLECFGRYRETEYEFMFESEEERLAERKRLGKRLEKLGTLMDKTSIRR